MTRPAGPPPMLELSRVDAGYSEKVVLRELSLRIEPGASLAVLGPNGSGKTTLLRTCSGLIRPSEGRVLVDGMDVTKASPHGRARLGVCHIPDPRGIFPNLTVRENLILQAHKRDAEEAIERAATAFPRLGQRLRQLAGTMSGGEQQMLAVARSYIQNPRIVLLDEVSMGLAPNLVDEIFEFLAGLKASGIALVVVEQFVHRALALTDDVVVLARGRIRLTGASASLDEEAIFDAYTGVGTLEGTVHA